MPIDPTATKRPRAERRNRNDAVMAAAVEVMSERGYAATSVQEVADRVGVLKGSLYHYFTSKEDLLFRIVHESHNQTVQIIEAVHELGLSPLEELLEYLRRQAVWYVDNRDRANIFFSDRHHLTNERLQQSNEWGRYFERHLQGLIEAGQAEGEIRDDLDVRLVTRYVLGGINNVRLWPSRSGKKFSTKEIAAAFADITRSAIAATTA
ncbi:TetR/AcrR family transcriptional regulator [Nocardioides sp. YJ-D4]